MSQAENPVLPKQFGERLRWFRNQRRLSQGDLGKTVGRTATSVSEWEKGTSEPSLGQIAALAEALGVPAARLAYGREEHSSLVEEPGQAVYQVKARSNPPISAPPDRAGMERMLDPRFQPRAEPTPEMCVNYFSEYVQRAAKQPGGVGYVWIKLMKDFPPEDFPGDAPPE